MGRGEQGVGGDMPDEVPLGPESAHRLPGGCREGTVESHWQGLRDLTGYRQPVAEPEHGRGLVPPAPQHCALSFWGLQVEPWSPPQGLGVGFSQNKAFSQDTCWGLGSSAEGPVPQILPLSESVDGLVTSQGGRTTETGVGGTFWAS